VFSGEIDIEDTMNLVVRYRNGVHLSYSLNAFEPKEGFEIRLDGTRGRLEHTTLETSYVSGADGQKVHETIPQGTHTLIFPHFGKPYPVDIWQAVGGHGGGDDPLLESVFLPAPPEDRYRRAASFAEGAYSILTGVAANRSMATGSPVRIGDLVKGIPEPDFTEMPEW
jgi:predicted dehydrogenase